MRAVALLAVACVSTLAHPVAGQNISDDSLATVLADYSEYCVKVRDHLKLADPHSADVILKPGAITFYVTGQGPVTLLDGSGLRCESGGYGYCGIARCNTWVFHHEKAQLFLGTVAVDYEGDELKLAICEGQKHNTVHCRDIDLTPLRSD